MKEKVRIVPLGGLNEIGKNLTVVECGEDIVIIDCGQAFPDGDLLGVDSVIPDITYLKRHKNKIRGIVITHGHEDHIGALPYVLRELRVPVYCTRLTAGLIQLKLEEHHMLNQVKIRLVTAGSKIQLGKLPVEFVRTNHSIPDSVAVAITTPLGIVVHTGDFKVGFDPGGGRAHRPGPPGRAGQGGGCWPCCPIRPTPSAAALPCPKAGWARRWRRILRGAISA